MDRAAPRGGFAPPVTPPVQPAAIEALVLAAGASRRMAPWHKLSLQAADGRSMIGCVIDALTGSRVRAIHVVVGHDAAAVTAAIGRREVSIVDCADYALGLSASLQAGLRALPAALDGVLVCLGDMPHVSSPLIDSVIGAWRPGCSVVPTWRGVRGNPVLWDRTRLGQMLGLTGDRGARALLDAGRVIEMAADDDACVTDADTPEALRALPGGPWRSPVGGPI